jgi:hypothetical protein
MNKKFLIVAGTVMAATGIYSAALTAASLTNATATVDVLAPLTLTQDTGMDFGDVAAATGSSSTVVLGTTDNAVAAGGAFATGPAFSADFSVTGDDANTYQITLPSTASLTSGGNPPMTVTLFTDSKGGTSAVPVTSTTSGGNDNFSVGATLTLGDGQPSGTYTGNYTISVDYN